MKSHHIRSFLFCLLLSAVLAVPALAGNEATDGLIPQKTTAGQDNIVRRARQLLELEWTPAADVVGWGGEVIYRAGTTYTGVPYGQPVDVPGYIGYNVSLESFVAATADASSRFYSVRSAYSKGSPCYATDCSGFVSYAWGLTNRENTQGLAKVGERVADQSINGLQVGDCLDRSNSHVALVSGVWYDASGKVAAVEIMDQNTGGPRRILCGPGGRHPLSWIQQYYFEGGYVLYRNPDRYDVPYIHSCAAPIDGDICANCSGQPIAPTPDPDPTPDPTPTPSTGTFSDVPDNAWYADYVEFVCSMELMNGTDDSHFTPNGTMSRAMFVTVLGRLAGVKTADYRTVPGPVDLQEGQYYTPYVKWAFQMGILDGVCSDGRFEANKDISREHMCLMLYNLACSDGVNFPHASGQRFTDDAQISPAAKTAIYSMLETGIVSGMGDGSFAPNGTATRAQAAKLFTAFLLTVM